MLNDYVLYIFFGECGGPLELWGPGPNGPVVNPPLFTVLRAHQMHYIIPKTDAGQTSDGEFKPLCIRELDNDDADGKPDSTDEDTPPNLSIGQ